MHVCYFCGLALDDSHPCPRMSDHRREVDRNTKAFERNAAGFMRRRMRRVRAETHATAPYQDTFPVRRMIVPERLVEHFTGMTPAAAVARGAARVLEPGEMH